MRKILGAAAALLLMGQAAPEAEVDDLAWIGGRWEAARENGRWTEEVWAGPRAGTLMGFSWTGAGSNVREYEYLRIQEGEGGGIVYLAQPGGRNAVPFYLVQAGPSDVTFENREHDFPQRIRYVRTGDTMVATISAIDGSNAMSWTFRRR